MRRRSVARLASIVALPLAALACRAGELPSQDGPIGTSVAGTIRARRSATALAASATPAAPSLTPTAPESSTPSATSSPTPTPTPSAPRANLTANANCRVGPLQAYDLVVVLLSGEQVELVARNGGGTYWYIRDEVGRECWLSGRAVQVSGDTSRLPVFTPPPSPTPDYDWSGNWNAQFGNNEGTLALTEDGVWINGVLNLGDQSFGIVAVQADGGDLVNGDLKRGSEILAVFTWWMSDSLDRFRGSWTVYGGADRGAFCGSRQGVPLPSPCER